MDVFGKPISVNYNGQTSFKTIPGGCCAVCMWLAVLSYLFIVWKEFYLRERWVLNQQDIPASSSEMNELITAEDLTNVTIGLQFSATEEISDLEGDVRDIVDFMEFGVTVYEIAGYLT